LDESARYLPVGDKALLVEFGNAIDITINRKVLALCDAVSRFKPRGVEERIPTYRSLLIYYDPRKVKYEQLVFQIKGIEQRLDEFVSQMKRRTVVVPTAYGGVYGSDLPYVGEYNHLTEEEVIRTHSEKEYAVFMIGFIAGFPYLEQVADEIATPRLKTPRPKVPAGSIGIAEKQTGIYPMESPGGWRLIGRTPIKLFDPSWPQPALLRPGDRVKFNPISDEEFEATKNAVLRNTYSPVIKEK
jgi:inhibitor of KinA